MAPKALAPGEGIDYSSGWASAWETIGTPSFDVRTANLKIFGCPEEEVNLDFRRCYVGEFREQLARILQIDEGRLLFMVKRGLYWHTMRAEDTMISQGVLVKGIKSFKLPNMAVIEEPPLAKEREPEKDKTEQKDAEGGTAIPWLEALRHYCLQVHKKDSVSIAEDDVVEVIRTFRTSATLLAKGLRGIVLKADQDGDVCVDFGKEGRHWVLRKHFVHFAVNPLESFVEPEG
eukprot:TRINITY_DN21862_c0_g1_i2.p1 TRINITY_DN21862_c0_g1~~TRINITY_DN21862_c0_g1_i2.p1  ORF type:complete len:246 (+),score=44.31 TRINITY_DN21862_c0_g1_i2:45-740(+)